MLTDGGTLYCSNVYLRLVGEGELTGQGCECTPCAAIPVAHTGYQCHLVGD